MPTRAGASWIYGILPLVSFVVAAGIGAYSAVRITAERFPDVASDTVHVSIATLTIANAVLALAAAVFGSQPRFASTSAAVAFALSTAAILAGNQLGLWHAKDARRATSA